MTERLTISEITFLRAEGEGQGRGMENYKSKHAKGRSKNISNYLSSNTSKLKKKLSEISWKLTGIFAQPIYLLDEVLEGDNKYSRIVNKVNEIYDDVSDKANIAYDNGLDKLNNMIDSDKIEQACEKVYQDLKDEIKAKMSTNVHKCP